VQVDPISAGAGDLFTIDGRTVPNLAPTGLRDLLTRATRRSPPCKRFATPPSRIRFSFLGVRQL
jgi:hypothetical protein